MGGGGDAERSSTLCMILGRAGLAGVAALALVLAVPDRAAADAAPSPLAALAPVAPVAPVAPLAPLAAEEEELALQPKAVWTGWLALLHYQRAGDGWRSEIATATFFLDAEGREDPEREWRAARLAFLGPAAAAQGGAHARCRFPARFAFMKQALGWRDEQLPPVACPELAAFEQQLGARTLAVVFASYFITNPASAFGHTMLYVGSEPAISPRQIQLADSGIAFEADTKGLSPVGYIPKGLAGELTAGFRVKPFYDLVRKYERQELRDLWLFPLQIEAAELAQLVRHTWELRGVSYRYGFFGGNCAQQILALVHAVAPRYRLLPFQRAAVLPAEVVRRLVDKIGVSGPPVLRLSLLGRYELARAQLGAGQRQQLDEMVQARQVPPRADAAVLSAALLWSELNIPYRTFRRAADLAQPAGQAGSADLRWRRALLEARERSGGEASAAALDDAWQTQPQAQPSLLDGHAPSRITLRGGRRRGGGVAELGVRWLLHDPIDPPTGYPAWSTLEVLHLEASLSTSGDLFLEEATAVRLEKLGRSSRLQSPLVWRLELGARRLATEGGDELHAGIEIAAGLGLATRPRPHLALAGYALLGVRPGAALPDGSDGGDGAGVRFAPLGLGTAGVIARVGPVRARLEAESAVQLRDLHLGHTLRGAARLRLARDWDVEVMLSRGSERALEATAGLVLFR